MPTIRRNINREKRFREILKYAWSNSPLYREIYSNAGIKEQDLKYIQLENLPVVTKSDLMVRFDEAVTDRRLKIKEIKNWHEDLENPLDFYMDRYLIMNCSGSSGYESWVPYTLKDWRLSTTSAVKDLISEQILKERPIRSAFYFTADRNSASGTNVILASRTTHDVLRLFQKDPIEEVCARLNAFKPERLTSLPSSIGWLLQWSEHGILKIKPKTVVVSGERLSSQVREAIYDTWNAEIFDLYATSESLYMGIRKPGNDEYKVYVDLNLIEVLDEDLRMVKTGERGRVFLTSLVNKTLPFIRYDLFDYATLGKKNFGAETLLSMDGRTYDGLTIPTINGGNHEIPVFALNEINIPKLKQIQYILHSPTHIEIQYIASENIDQEIEDYFKALVGENFQAITRLDINHVNHIANGADTKFHNVVRHDESRIQLNSFSGQSFPNKFLTISREKDVVIPYQLEKSNISINEKFRQIVSIYAERKAVIGLNKTHTYSSLNKYSDQIAKALLNRGFDRNQPVCILSGHQPDSIAMFLGILKAGGYFLYLDPSLPEIRNAKILADIQPRVILTMIRHENYVHEINVNQAEVLLIDNENFETNDDYYSDKILPYDPACLLYTSGTTGPSKGVILSHRTILSRVTRASEDLQINKDDNISLIQSMGVNAGIRDIFTSLLNGASLALFDIQEHGISRLGKWIKNQNITHLYFVPVVWRLFNATDKERNYPSIQIVRFGGEPVTQNDITDLCMKFDTECYFINAYASTETGTICQYIMTHTSQFVEGRVPVGRSVKGISVILLDDIELVTNYMLGEIAVHGDGLAFGYWDPDQRKIQPFEGDYFLTGDLGYQIENGCYFLLGRKDRIIKIHGHRINLDEIEDLIRGIEGIANAAVGQITASNNKDELSVYYELNQNSYITSEEIERRLVSNLPGRKINISYYPLPKLPQLPGGKLNSNELWDLSIHPGKTKSPDRRDLISEEELLNGTEKALAGIWQDVLKCGLIRRDDNFLFLGGDSIAIFRVLSRIEEFFGVNISVMEFFQFKSLQSMAQYIDLIHNKNYSSQ